MNSFSKNIFTPVLTIDIVRSNLASFDCPMDLSRRHINDVFVLLQLIDRSILDTYEYIDHYNPAFLLKNMQVAALSKDTRTIGDLIDELPVEVIQWVSNMDKDTVATIVYVLKFISWFYSSDNKPFSSRNYTAEDGGSK